MRYIIFIASLFLYRALKAQQPLPAIGQWREHLPYNSAIDVTSGDNKVWCATPYSLFTVNIADPIATGSIERLSRVTGLNETGISAIKYDETNSKLFIAYNNSNIDIIYRNDIYNIPDIKRDNIIGDKSIYNIYPLGKNYYLSTGLGIIVIDGDKYEVKDSWFIGNGGNHIKVNGFTSDANFFYAATDEGLKRAAINITNLANYTNWQIISGSNGLSTGACKNVVNVQNKIVAEENDSLFALNGNLWTLLYGDGWPIVSSNASGNKLQLCQRFLNGTSRVAILNADGTVDRTLIQAGVISFPRKAILVNNDPWIADQFGSLSHFFSSSYEQYKLNSPEEIANGQMTVHNNIFYATAGQVNDAWIYQYNGNGIYIFKEGS